jgi:thioredoxin-related protein
MSRRASRRHLLLALLSAPLAGPLSARAATEDSLLTRIDDLRTLAVEIRTSGRPLLLFFSLPGCPHCLAVRRAYLAPRLRAGEREVLIREIEVTSARSLLDLQGHPISEAQLAKQLAVKLTPHVQLVDDRLRSLGEPIVGDDRSGFYETVLVQAIEAARQALRAAR